MGNAAGGVHMAALGALWQAAVFGVAGLRVRENGIVLDPHLLPGWAELAFPVQWRGRLLRVRLQADPPLNRTIPRLPSVAVPRNPFRLPRWWQTGHVADDFNPFSFIRHDVAFRTVEASDVFSGMKVIRPGLRDLLPT